MTGNSKNPFATQKDLVLEKLKKYCAYRDRCHQEVRTKLLKLKIYGDDLEEIIAELIMEGFLNEERFTRSFIRGKFRINQWGRNKIRQNLKQKAIPDSLIDSCFEEIDEADYLETLNHLMIKKANQITIDDPFEKKKRVIRYATSKGFENYLVIEESKKLKF